VNGSELATFLCTPITLDYLTIGFLAFEGIIRGIEDVRALDVDLENGVVESRFARPWCNQRSACSPLAVAWN
jgi:FdhD protein